MVGMRERLSDWKGRYEGVACASPDDKDDDDDDVDDEDQVSDVNAIIFEKTYSNTRIDDDCFCVPLLCFGMFNVINLSFTGIVSQIKCDAFGHES